MNKNTLKYILIYLFILSSLNAVENNDLNLEITNKLNRVEGKEGILPSIVKDEKEDIPNLIITPKNRMPVEEVDISGYAKVKLIDAVYETLSNSDLLKSSREKVIQYELKVKKAISNNYPTIDFEYNLGRTRSYPSGDDLKKFKYFSDKNYKFVLKQNLYSGKATYYDIKSAAKKLEVSKNQYKITLDEMIKKAVKAYFGVVFTNRSVMVNERNMKKLNKILKIITIKYENGAASIGDITSIKANVANSTTKILKVKSKFVEALKYYEYIVGINFEKTMPYEKNFDVNVGEFEELYHRVLKKNRNLINYYKSIEAEIYKQKNAESSFAPKVDFEIGFKKTIDTEDLEEEESDLNAKIKFSYNIFNAGRDKNKVLEVASGIRDLKYRLEEEKRKLKWNLSKIHTSIQSVGQALNSTISEIISSRKMVSAYWDAFKLGEQDLQVLLQGQKQLNSAETELVKFEESHITGFFNILELTGDLSSFFDVDPENPKFIDFTKSTYSENIFGKKNDDNSSKDEKVDLEREVDDVLKEIEDEKVVDIPLPKPSLNENINNYLEKFQDFDDESYMIEISSFGNIYESFDFIKENNLDSNSFSYDVIKKYNILTRIAHNNFETEDAAIKYVEALTQKDLNKQYDIRKVKDIKDLYNKYINGLEVKEKIKIRTKIKVIEKIRQAVKKKEFLTNEEFKNKLLSAKDSEFTINVSSFTKLENVENFIMKNNIYDESFFFRYGDNGQLIKLLYGVYNNYNSIDTHLNKLISENKNIYPIVERIGLVKKLYNENIIINTKSDEPIEYEYINLSKEDKKRRVKKKEIKKPKKLNKEKNEIFTLTKRPNLEDIDRKKKEELNNIEKELDDIKKVEKKEVKEKINVDKEVISSMNLTSFEKKFLNSPKNNFTSNLATFSTMDLARNFVKINKIKDNTILVISNNNKVMVMSGIYTSFGEGIEAVESLPSNLKRNKPFIQKIFRTQDSYRKNNPKNTQFKMDNTEEIAEKKKEELILKQEAFKLDEIKKQEEMKVLEEKAKLEKEVENTKREESKKLAEIKKQKEAEQLAEIKRQEVIKAEEEKVRLKVEAKKLAEVKKQKDIKAKKELELRDNVALSDFEHKFLNAPKNYFTSNLATFETMTLAKNFVNTNKVKDSSILVISNNNKIMVMNGVYSSVVEALENIENLPVRLKRNKPFIQKIFRTQDSYNKNNLNKNNIKEIEEEKEKLKIVAEAKKLAEIKRQEEIKALEVKARLKKEAETKKLIEIKKQQEAKKLAEIKRQEDIKALEEKTKLKKESEVIEKLTLSDFERKFLNAPKDYYTSNLAAFSNMKLATNFVKINKIKDDTILVISNSKMIMVMFGVYSKRDDALSAVESFSSNLKRNKPFIQRIFRTQASYNKNNLNKKEIKKQDEIKAVEEKVRLKKEAEAKEVAKIKQQKIEKLEKEAEAKKLIEIKKQQESKKLAEIKRQEEIKAKVEKARLKKEAEAKALAKIKQQKIEIEKEKLKKEAEAKKLIEIKKQQESKKLAEIKRQEEIKAKVEKARLKKEAETKKLKEIKKQQESKKLAEIKRQEDIKAEEEKIRLKEKTRTEAAKLAGIKNKKEIKAKKELKVISQSTSISFEKQFLNAPRDYFTSNLATFETMTLAKNFVNTNKIKENSILVISNNNKIMVMNGVYSSVVEALENIENLPARLKRNKPFIQKIFRTQDSYNKNNLNKNIEEKKIKIQKKIIVKTKKLTKKKNIKKITTLKSNIKKEKKIVEKKSTTLFNNNIIKEIDFSNDLNKKKKEIIIPYAKRVENFKNKFALANANKYTLKLVTIKNSQLAWYTRRFQLEPYYTVIPKTNKVSIIYYGIYNSIEDAKQATETLHPKIFELNPPVKRIGAIK